MVRDGNPHAARAAARAKIKGLLDTGRQNCCWRVQWLETKTTYLRPTKTKPRRRSSTVEIKCREFTEGSFDYALLTLLEVIKDPKVDRAELIMDVQGQMGVSLGETAENMQLEFDQALKEWEG